VGVGAGEQPGGGAAHGGVVRDEAPEKQRHVAVRGTGRRHARRRPSPPDRTLRATTRATARHGIQARDRFGKGVRERHVRAQPFARGQRDVGDSHVIVQVDEGAPAIMRQGQERQTGTWGFFFRHRWRWRRNASASTRPPSVSASSLPMPSGRPARSSSISRHGSRLLPLDSFANTLQAQCMPERKSSMKSESDESGKAAGVGGH